MTTTSRRRRTAPALFGLVLLAGGLSACTSSPAQPSAQQRAATAFARALGAGDVPAAASATDDPEHAEPVLQASLAGLGNGTRARFEIGEVTETNHRATARYVATWTLPGGQKWTYRGSLPLRERAGGWRVHWLPSDLHPRLTTGEHLAVQRTPAQRGNLLDRSGAPLFRETPVVRVGVEKKLVTNLDILATTLAAVPELQSGAEEIRAAVRSAAPTDFVPIVTLRRPVYDRIKARIHDLPGTVFQTGEELLPPESGFGEPLLGSVGQATAEDIAKSGGRLRAGDLTGSGGLQQAFDKQLSGTPGTTVVAQPDRGSAAPVVLSRVSAPKPGTDVRLTLDRGVQAAAEAALAGVRQAATIVAVQRSTGRILADANTSAVTYDLGLAGAVPAGSTFKIATWAAAFMSDPALTPATTVPCPATVTVDGRHFVNENRFSYPPIPISAAFGYSCNTSAIEQAMSMPPDALRTAAHALGLGADWSLPVASFSGSLPLPDTATERAADGIGQGRVQVSPLLMALMADAATTGRPAYPTLQASTGPRHGAPLPSGITAKMTTLMKATVDLPAGTAHELAGLGGIEGKTGTAEYGDATPPRSHSWFAGVDTGHDIAFAVFVYDGASAQVDAVPLAHDFLGALG